MAETVAGGARAWTARIPGGERFTRAFAVVLAAAVGLAYANSFGIGFYFDDIFGIAENPSLRSLANVPSYFTDPFTLTTVRDNVDVRPVLQVSYALNWAISGSNPWSYHAVNILLHLVAALTVFVVVRDHVWWPAESRGPDGAARFPAAGCALLFALAPLNSQALDYGWARSALLMTVFYLGAFLASLRGRLVWAGLLHALALWTKAVALTLPVALLAYACIYRDRSRHPTLLSWLRGWQRLVLPLGSLAALNVLYLLHRKLVLPPWFADANKQPWVTPEVWLMSQWSALLEYVRLFAWPSGLSVDHDFPYATSLAQPRAWLALAVLLAWIGLVARHARRHPVPAFATAWFFVTLSIESSLFPLAEVINDHRPYIATSLGLALLLAWGLWQACGLLGESRGPAAFAAVVAAACLLAIPVIRHRNWEWQDPERLWRATVETSPGNGRAWMNLGTKCMQRGALVEARQCFEKARELSPNYAHVYMNLSVLDAHEGRIAEAVVNAEKGVQLMPEGAAPRYYLGQALAKAGRWDEADAAYHKSLELDPRHERSRTALEGLATESDMAAGMLALQRAGGGEEAVARFRAVLQRMPEHYGATFQLARALDSAGRTDEALAQWKRALAAAEAIGDESTIGLVRARLAPGGAPPGPPAANETAEARTAPLMKEGLDALHSRHDPATAITRFEEVLAIVPDHYGATWQLAVALDAANRRSEGQARWREALALAERYHDEPRIAAARERLAEQR